MYTTHTHTIPCLGYIIILKMVSRLNLYARNVPIKAYLSYVTPFITIVATCFSGDASSVYELIMWTVVVCILCECRVLYW